MKKNLTLTLAALGLACVGGSLALARRSPSQHVASTTSMLPPPPGARAEEDASDSGVQAALDAGDDARAARLLDVALAQAARRGDRFQGGSSLHDLRMRLLRRRGQDGAAVDETVALLRGDYGGYLPDTPSVAPVLEAALRLRRAKDADAIATWIEENDRYLVTSSPALNRPDAPATPALRLAYTDLMLAYWGGADRVRYAERAVALAPNEVPVLVQAALARFRRGAKDDQARGERLVARAYALLPPGSGARRDLRSWAYGSARFDPAGPNARATLNADIDRSAEETRLRDDATRAAKAREAARLREARGMPPLGVTPPHP